MSLKEIVGLLGKICPKCKKLLYNPLYSMNPEKLFKNLCDDCLDLLEKETKKE